MFSSELNIVFSFLSSFLLTFLIIPKIILFSKRLRLFDMPGHRAAHNSGVPIFGGVAIFIGVIFSLLIWGDLENIQFLLASLLVVFFVGLIDDLLSLSPVKKILGQIIAILIIIYLQEIKIDNFHGVLSIYDISNLFSLLFTVFVVIVITNGFNLIDGVDGLAGGVGIISSLAFGIIALIMNQHDIAIISFTLSGSLVAFLKYNFHPASIFMGDTGSLVVGMILSILAINLIDTGIVTNTISFPNKGPLLAIIFLAIPLFDSLRVFLNRVRKGKQPLTAARDHVHHALLDLGLGHKNTARVIYLISIFLIVISYFLLPLNINIGILILAVITYLILLFPYILKK